MTTETSQEPSQIQSLVQLAEQGDQTGQQAEVDKIWQLLQDAYQQQVSETVDSLWAQLSRSANDNPEPALLLIKSLLRVRDYSGALHAAEQAVRCWGEDEQVRLRYQQLQYLYGRDSTADPMRKPPNLKAPDLTAATAMLSIQQYADEASNEALIPLLKALLKRWPSYLPALRMQLTCWLRESRYEEIVAFCQRRYDTKQQFEDFTLLQWVLALSALGRIEQAVELVRQAETQGHIAKVVQHLLINTIGQGLSTNPELRAGLEAMCREHGIDGLEHAIEFEKQLRPPQRSLIASFDSTQSVVASPLSASSCLVIVFTGFARRVGAVPQELLDRFFAGHGVAMVRLIDKSGHSYLDGVPELGANFEETIMALRQMAAEYGASRIITLGNSGGGMGAMRYGAALNASHVLAFSPAVNLDMAFLEAHGDYRARAAIRKLNRLFSPETLDVRCFIENSGFTGRMDVYAGAQSEGDQHQIQHLSNLENVYLHSIDTVSVHDSIGPAVLKGMLLSALNKGIL